MANIINQILEIDRLAVEKLDQANQKKASVLNEVEQIKNSMYEDLQGKATTRIEKVREIEKSYAQTKINKIKDENDKIIKSLEDKYTQNHVEWEQTILENILCELG